MSEKEIIIVGNIENKIYSFRGKNVMLDSDLAKLYGVETFNLNKSVKRNIERFPEDFMFQLSDEEYNNLKFQIAITRHLGLFKKKAPGLTTGRCHEGHVS